ncbi:hypothetical protein [Streptomyces pini]|uniref:Minor tail protein n=1 Tax=Streptomyces pini TaxID=1520580 RepID=A0A1I4BWM2_9ACTN|nr:hypothetical protein [Streptomyces pini]SFK72830.1 hypothetical protein SAMN05192584_108158 [Streptomyces pini]
MSGAARQLGEDLARAASGTGGGTVVSAQVVDVTDAGTVNLDLGGALILDVPCADSYRGRQAGDWVAVRPGARPVVMWRLGEDPGALDEDAVREIALGAQAVRAMTWGTGTPSGDGWMQPTALYVRKAADGKAELYAQVATEPTDPPDEPTGAVARPVSLSPTDSGSWRGGRPDSYADFPMQGDWTGGGDRRGGWFYGTAIADACSGKTVAKMTVGFTRRRGSGVNAKRPLHLYLHSYTSPPSGQLSLGDGPEDLLRLSVGGTGTATLPAAWRTALATGAARGLAIYARGSTDYMAVSGGTLKIEFS